MARYYETLDLADQGIKYAGNNAINVLQEALSTKKLNHIVDGEVVVRTLSATDITAILDAITHYNQNRNNA